MVRQLRLEMGANQILGMVELVTYQLATSISGMMDYSLK